MGDQCWYDYFSIISSFHRKKIKKHLEYSCLHNAKWLSNTKHTIRGSVVICSMVNNSILCLYFRTVIFCSNFYNNFSNLACTVFFWLKFLLVKAAFHLQSKITSASNIIFQPARTRNNISCFSCTIRWRRAKDNLVLLSQTYHFWLPKNFQPCLDPHCHKWERTPFLTSRKDSWQHLVMSLFRRGKGMLTLQISSRTCRTGLDHPAQNPWQEPTLNSWTA